MVAGQLFSSYINVQIGNFNVPEVQVSAGTANMGFSMLSYEGTGDWHTATALSNKTDPESLCLLSGQNKYIEITKNINHVFFPS